MDDKQVDDGRRIKASTTTYSAVLTNKDARRTDSGTYTIKISNKAGTDTAIIRVAVLGKFKWQTTWDLASPLQQRDCPSCFFFIHIIVMGKERECAFVCVSVRCISGILMMPRTKL